MSFWSRLPQPILGLAPMDGVTDAAFRRVVAAQGRPDVTFTEFTNVGDVCRGPEHLLSSLIYSEAERPIVAQLYGKDPDQFYRAAQVVGELGFDGLDINMGCPSKSVAASGSGAALIKTPDLAHAIVRAARQGLDDWAAGQSIETLGFKPSRIEGIQAMNRRRTGLPIVPRRSVPLSIKTRLGFDCIVVERWVEHLLETGPAAITLHGRTLQQMYRGAADWSAIAVAAMLARGTQTLILGNGDVQTLADAVKRIAESRVRGVLVGRGTLGAPWFFRGKERARRAMHEQTDLSALAATTWEPQVSVAQRMRVMLDHARQYEAIAGLERFRSIRKHLGWYCKGFPHAAAMRTKMFQVCNVPDVERVVEEFCRDLMVAELDLADTSPFETRPSQICVS
ncbi:MAG: tRNA-dihydrouridine synthase DusB [Nitrospira sp.]|nr:MAG: tRNA-dihydrouridine synthase DusB [Nitrospira sp.]